KLNWAAASPVDAAGWRALAAIGEAWTAPRLPINGADAAAAGLPKGPKVGEALRALEAWWIEGDFTADRAQALAKLKELIG
ncbi:MAG TPA: CCA tRNA nucleotidyltransferase, partial [Phenylobacterium sp.]|nr:CCA tRNA nucleotidyltransferase [Phenylobacterium sp.]